MILRNYQEFRLPKLSLRCIGVETVHVLVRPGVCVCVCPVRVSASNTKGSRFTADVISSYAFKNSFCSANFDTSRTPFNHFSLE